MTVTERETRLWPVSPRVLDRAGAIMVWAQLAAGRTLVRQPRETEQAPEVWEPQRLEDGQEEVGRQRFEELIGLKTP